MHYRYKFNGLIVPYGIQAVFALALVAFWVLGLGSGAPLLALGFAFVISAFVAAMAYWGYPLRFEARSAGLAVGFTFGGGVEFAWQDIVQFKRTGPVAVIQVRRVNWASRVINKYFVFLWLLEDADGFCRAVEDRGRRSEVRSQRTEDSE